MPPTRLLPCVAWVLAVAAGCGQSESSTANTTSSTTSVATETSIDSTTTTQVPTTTAVTTTTTQVPATTVAPTSTAAPTSTVPPPTTVPPTTTTGPPATTVPPTTTTVAPTVPIPDRAFAQLGSDLVEVDVATGETQRVVVEFFEEGGLFRGGLRIDPSGSFAWFNESYEDYWYGCESSVGSIGRVDLTTGAIEQRAAGFGPAPSDDGQLLAYVTSRVCLPDPEAPEFWVLTPPDRVVVRQIATGGEREFVTTPTPETYDAPSSVLWADVAPSGELLVLTVDGTLRSVGLDGSSVLQDHPVVLSGLQGSPVGVSDGVMDVVVYGDEGSADLFAVELSSGARTPLASSERYVAVGRHDPSGQLLVAGPGEIAVEPGAPVTVLTVPDGGYVSSLDW